MKKINLIVSLQLTLSLLFLDVPAFARSKQQKKWEGYKLATDVDFQNKKLQDFANNAVFQVVTADVVDSVQQVKIVDTNTTSWVPESEIEILQLETCKRQNLARCPILSQRMVGTLFFNKGKFYTCRHAIHNWLYYAALENNKSIEDLFPPIVLNKATRQGNQLEEVYSSGDSQQELMRLSFAQTQPAANFLYIPKYMSQKKDLFNFSDIVQMTLSRQNLVRDLKLPEIQSYPDSMNRYNEIYIVGYPGQRQFNKENVGDSPGRTLMASNGYIDHSNYDVYRFKTTAIATGGMSGSPVLSSDATIIGMSCSSDNLKTPSGSTDPRNFHSYPIPLNIDFFVNLWAQYNFPTTLIPQNVQQTAVSN